jgi:Rho GTPase-activating protein 1
MRSHLKQRVRGRSISTVVPPTTSPDYLTSMSKAAASILYRSPLPSPSGLPIYILNAAALPDTHEVDYDTLLPYVLARLPGEDELVSGAEYEVIFFAGGPAEGATSTKKNHPGVGWFIQAYHVLSRAMRKRIQKLYIVHQRTWVRMLVEMFSTIASPKFKKKIVHGMHLSHSYLLGTLFGDLGNFFAPLTDGDYSSFHFKRSSIAYTH